MTGQNVKDSLQSKSVTTTDEPSVAELISAVTESIMAYSGRDFAEVAGPVLEKVARYLQVDRLHIAFASTDAKTLTDGFVVHILAREAAYNKISATDMSSYGWISAKMLLGETVSIQDLDKFDLLEAESDREVLQSFGMQSFLGVPLSSAGRHTGQIGCFCKTTAEWTAVQEAVLKSVGALLCAVYEKWAAESQARERDELFRNLYENVTAGVMIFDPDGNVIHANTAACSILGTRFDKIINTGVVGLVYGHVWEDLTSITYTEHPLYRALSERVDTRNFAIGVPATDRRADKKWLLAGSQPVVDPDTDELKGALLTFTDITDRKQAEEEVRKLSDELRSLVENKSYELAEVTRELRDSENRYRELLECQTDMVLRVDAEGVVTFVNRAGTSVLGTTNKQVLGATFSDYLDYANEDDFYNALKTARNDRNVRLETRIMTPDGQRYFELAIYPVGNFGLGKESYQIVGRDITNRRQSTELIERRNAQLSALNSIGSILFGSEKKQDMLEDLTVFLGRELGFEAGCAYSYDPATKRLKLEHGWGLLESLEGRINFLPPLIGYCEEAIEKQGPVLIKDVKDAISIEGQQEQEEAQIEYSIESGMCIPLWADGGLKGVLQVFSSDCSVFSEGGEDFFDALGKLVGIALHKHTLYEQVINSNTELHALSRKFVMAYEEDLRNIARELHDEVGRIATGLAISLGMSSRTRDEKQAEANIGHARNLVNELSTRVRELSLHLRPPMLDDLGLLPTLLWYIDRYETQTQIKVVFEQNIVDKRFTRETEIAAFRVVQESLTNVARHAQVSEVGLSIWSRDDTLGLQVTDQGAGFLPEEKTGIVSTSGLTGMRERVHSLGGKIKIDSGPGEGTCITATFSLNDDIDDVQSHVEDYQEME